MRRIAPNNPLRNAAGKTFRALCIPASRGKPVIFTPLKIPLGACASPMFFTPVPMTVRVRLKIWRAWRQTLYEVGRKSAFSLCPLLIRLACEGG